MAARKWWTQGEAGSHLGGWRALAGGVSDRAHDQPPPPHPSRRRHGRRPRARGPRAGPATDDRLRRRRRDTAEQALAFTGSGYTPSGPVQLLFSVPGEARASFTGAADAAGGIAGRLGVEEDALLAKDEDRRDLAVTATDQTRADAGAPPESQFGIAQLTFTRWAGLSPGRYVPGRKVEVETYALGVRRRQAAVLPLPEGPHDRRGGPRRRPERELRRPRGAHPRAEEAQAPGAYRLVLSTEKRTPQGLYTWRKGRVVKRASASAASAGAMAHG